MSKLTKCGVIYLLIEIFTHLYLLQICKYEYIRLRKEEMNKTICLLMTLKKCQ